MEHDYYQVLGISPTADFDTIRKAFRGKVMECHPDRGGSHTAMVLVNEAWEVLSKPELRSRYDAARTYAGDHAAQQAAEADAKAARQRAEQYPPKWADVEAWLNGVAQDFAGAEYGSVQLYQDVSLPTAGGSVSGWAFILIGAVLGGVFLSTAIYGFLDRNKDVFFKKYQILGLFGLALVAAPVIGGAWAGAGAHKLIGDEIKTAKERAVRQAQRMQEQEAKRQQTSPPAAEAVESKVLACERCGQKLRVPSVESELLVTCKSCGHKFTCGPSSKLMWQEVADKGPAHKLEAIRIYKNMHKCSLAEAKSRVEAYLQANT